MATTQEQAAAALVDRTFQLMCFTRPSFTSEEVRQECIKLIEKEIARTQFVTQIIGE
jgi:hypothetical protein